MKAKSDKIGDRTFKAPVKIALRNEIPPISQSSISIAIAIAIAV